MAALVMASCWTDRPRFVRNLPSERFVLANGLRVILLEDATAPLVLLNSCVEGGAMDEPAGKTGLAHLVEHLAVRGFSRERAIEPGTFNNGITDFDRTCFSQKLPSNRLESGLAVERERLEIKPTIEAQRFEEERRSVLQEMRERFAITIPSEGSENQAKPAGTSPFPSSWLLSVRSLIWPEFSSWDSLPLGRSSDVLGLQPSDAERFLADWYTPSNTTLVLVGAVKAASARPLVEKWLGDLPARVPAKRRTLRRPERLTAARKTISAGRDAKSVTFAWRVPTGLEEHAAEIQLLARLLGDHDHGRITMAFRTWGHPVLGATTIVESEAGIGAMLVRVDLAPSTSLREAEGTLSQVIERLRTQSISQQEWEEVAALAEAR
ncbi:MAG TPA: pitrilysin family protein, partial [Polyangia bacterium]